MSTSVADETDAPSQPAATLCWLVEPAFMGHDLGVAPKDSQSTLFAPGVIGLFGPEVLTPEKFEALGVSRERFAELARAGADALVANLKPTVIRDPDGNADYAIFESEDGTACQVLFSPSVVAKFRDSMGGRLLVAVPDRDHAFVFPRSMDTFRKLGKVVATRYRDAVYPCSLELFEVSNDQPPRAVGAFAGADTDAEPATEAEAEAAAAAATGSATTTPRSVRPQ